MSAVYWLLLSADQSLFSVYHILFIILGVFYSRAILRPVDASEKNRTARIKWNRLKHGTYKNGKGVEPFIPQPTVANEKMS